MQVWTDLSNPTDKAALLDSCAKTTTSTGENSYVPLQFWFCRNPGLALPLIALQYHEVKLNVTFSTAAHQLGTVSVWCDYVFLDTDERRRFAQVSHEYLIEQVQYSNALSVDGTATQHELRFNHPVKELVWTVHGGAGETKGTSPTVPVDTDITVTDALLQLNGHDRFKRRDGKYFTTVQRYQHHSGSSNAVRRPAASLAHKVQAVSVDTGVTTISNWTRDLEEEAAGTATIFDTPTYVTTAADALSGTVLTGLGGLGLGASTTYIALNYTPTTFRLYPATSNAGIAEALAGKNYVVGTVSDGTDLVVDTLKLTPKTTVLDDSIPHVYSFALKPEEHQPSGTCNFSRIDNAVLNMTHGDVGANGTLNVYAVNYNVLRIMSGMGGLAYSN